MDQLIPGIALSGTRLIGMELDFTGIDERGRVWIPLDAGTHLLYGKNGVGKSTILRALRAALTADESEDTLGFAVRLFVEIHDLRPQLNLDLDFSESDTTGVDVDSSDTESDDEINDDLGIDEYDMDTEDESEYETKETNLVHGLLDYSGLSARLFQGEWWQSEQFSVQEANKWFDIQETFYPDS